MMSRTLLIVLATLLIFTQSLSAGLTSMSRVISNESFVRQSLKVFFAELIDSAGMEPGTTVAIEFTGPQNDNLDVTGSALTVALKESNVTRVTEAESTDRRFEIDVDEVSLMYENRNGNMFSRGDVHRILHAAASFRNSNAGVMSVRNFLIRDYESRVALSDIATIEDESSPFFFAQLPPGPVQRLWEPVIVTSVIGGLVYLFFASR